MGFPGYNGEVPRENGFLSEILRQQGYATYAVGKWHLTPDDETNMAGPRHSWPLARGFDRWYGFHGGETHQFVPTLYHDNHSIQPPKSIEEGYHLSADLADQAIAQLADLRAVDVDRRFFLYLCTGACHSPHHAPASWIERYRGRFDKGWDRWREETFARQLESGLLAPGTEMAPRPPWVPAWDDLPPDQQRVAARFMECFAAFLSYTDAQLARVLEFLEQTGDRDDTLVILVSDNGASSEGGVDRVDQRQPAAERRPGRPGRVGTAHRRAGRPDRPQQLPVGLDDGRQHAVQALEARGPRGRCGRPVHRELAGPARVRAVGCAGSSPTPSTSFPPCSSWPASRSPSTIEYVPQTRIDGISFASLLGPGGADAPPHRTTQHFEMFGSRALYHDGWKAVTFKPIGPLYDDGINWNAPFSEDRWELYHVESDPSEIHDLADQHPERLADMVDRWWVEAGRNQVLPLDNRVLHTLINPKPDRRAPRLTTTYYAGGSPVPETCGRQRQEPQPCHRGRPHRSSRRSGPRGCCWPRARCSAASPSTCGPGASGTCTTSTARSSTWWRPPVPVEPGRHRLGFRFERQDDGGGAASLTVDGAVVAEGHIPRFTVAAFSATGAGLTCGYELGPAVGDDYEAPFRCTATIHTATVTLSEHVPVNPMVEFERIMAEQ